MSSKGIGLLIICGGISLSLIAHLWQKQEGSAAKKIFWSIVTLLPLIGWVFYGAFYNPPGKSDIKAQGRAAGWARYWPKD